MSKIDTNYYIKYSCDLLIDQDHYIGDDPIGHHCLNAAKYQIKINDRDYLICEECLIALRSNLNNRTFPIIGGREVQDKAIEILKKDIVSRK